jgi:hypothetical protein
MYYRWSIGNDVSLFLDVVRSDGVGLTGSDPQVSIRRYRSVDGGFLDNYYWDGSSFTSTPTSASMVELDSANLPGIYTYTFSQSLIQSSTMYVVYYKHNTTPVGYDTERHYFLMSGTSGDLKVYESEID